jgi:FkbM family methyltransferase
MTLFKRGTRLGFVEIGSILRRGRYSAAPRRRRIERANPYGRDWDCPAKVEQKRIQWPWGGDLSGVAWWQVRELNVEGQLFDDVRVDLDPESLLVGGSWFSVESRPVPKAWETENIRFFYERAQCLKSPRILDIGANTGSYCLIAKALPLLQGYAIEPNPGIFRILQRNLQLNGLGTQIRAVQAALGDRNGTTCLRVPVAKNDSGLATLGIPARFPSWVELKVPMVTMDDFVARHFPNGVDLIKIDTEGAELAILKGGKGVLEKFRPEVLAEYYAENTRQFGYEPEEILRFMSSLGYSWIELGNDDLYFRHSKAFRF